MNTIKRFFCKYLFSSMMIILVFIISNIIILLGILLIARNNFHDNIISTSQIADHINVDNQWNVSTDNELIRYINEKNIWVMLLDDNGTVIWENSMPQDLPRQYSASDIAKFSRWYLKEYPVLVQALSKGLLVIAYPPGSITKLNYITNQRSIDAIIYVSIFILIANILLVLLLFWHNTSRVEKAVSPILNGIDTIVQGHIVSIPEKGELAEINKKLNLAGKHILKKDKTRADWINGISHDIRTPLSIILGYAEDIESNQSLPKNVQEKANIIRKQSEKLRQLITDLNLTSRLEHSMQPLNITTLYLVELARQVIIEFLNNGLDKKYQIDLDVLQGASEIVMQGDFSLISRMLNNLIQNSISHNPDGCHIIVTVRKSSKGVEYLVTDNGVGLSKKQLEHFNNGDFLKPNYKANGETDHGFGLQLVQQIVKAHGGNIKYENTLPCGLSINIFFLV